MIANKHMKISELADLTKLPISTIKYYISEGLLPKRAKTGKTVVYFTSEHVDRLKYIQTLKQDKKLTIKMIKGIIKERNGKGFEKVDSVMIFSSKRQAIIQAAIRVFSEKGYHDASVKDIVNTAGIGRNTFYSFYKNKEALFLECADKVFNDLISEQEKELINEKDITKRFRKRLIHAYFLRPYIMDMLNVVKAASIDNDLFKKKFKQLIQNFVRVIVKELESGIKDGLFREVNTGLTSYLLMGLTEYGFHFLQHETDVPFEEVFSQFFDFVNNGLRPNHPKG